MVICVEEKTRAASFSPWGEEREGANIIQPIHVIPLTPLIPLIPLIVPLVSLFFCELKNIN